MSAEVTYTGPLFDGSADKEMAKFVDESEEELAQLTYDEVRHILDKDLRRPTGYYESRIATERAQDDVFVTDSGVVYGPWLEGVSSRNKRSRFKGYAAFRRATQAVQARAVKETERLFKSKYLGRLQ